MILEALPPGWFDQLSKRKVRCGTRSAHHNANLGPTYEDDVRIPSLRIL